MTGLSLLVNEKFSVPEEYFQNKKVFALLRLTESCLDKSDFVKSVFGYLNKNESSCPISGCTGFINSDVYLCKAYDSKRVILGMNGNKVVVTEELDDNPLVA